MVKKGKSEGKAGNVPTKKRMAVLLSMLESFDKPKVSIEQYVTDPEIAATALWHAYMANHIKGKVVADLGSGTGILGLGALLLGAKRVFLVEKDKEAMHICLQNYETLKRLPSVTGEAVFLAQDIAGFDEIVDTVLQNPPFGTRQKHADRIFLEKAFSLAPIIYSFHKTATSKFIHSSSEKKGFSVVDQLDFAFPLKATYAHHKRRIHRIEVSFFCFKKK